MNTTKQWKDTTTTTRGGGGWDEQADYHQHHAFRHWCTMVGFILGTCMLITGVVLLIKPVGWGDEGRHLETSIIMLATGVVCLFSVFMFYVCSKIRKGSSSFVIVGGGGSVKSV